MQLIGLARLGRDAEARTVGENVVANLGLAFDYYDPKSTAQNKRSTTWVDAALWGKQATSLEQYLKKGSCTWKPIRAAMATAPSWWAASPRSSWPAAVRMTRAAHRPLPRAQLLRLDRPRHRVRRPPTWTTISLLIERLGKTASQKPSRIRKQLTRRGTGRI
jgi:hypothetical protein